MTEHTTNHTTQTRPTTRTIKQTINVFSSESRKPVTILKETLPEITNTYTLEHNELFKIPVNAYADELFDGFLFIELDKLKDLTKMYCESEYSSNSMFGDILFTQLSALKERLREAAHHIKRTVGTIGVVQTNLHTRCFEVGTIIDAGYYDNGMVTDSRPLPLQGEDKPKHCSNLSSQEGGAK